jgi:hypothetical protein
MRKKIISSSDGGDSGGKKYKRGYGGAYDAACGINRVPSDEAMEISITFFVLVQGLPKTHFTHVDHIKPCKNRILY